MKSSTTHLSERGGLRRVASAARGDRGVPQARGVGGAGEHDERAAAREEDGEGGEVGVDVVLIDARFIQPDERLLAVGDAALLGAPRRQLRELGGAVVLPRMRDEGIDGSERGADGAAVHRRVLVRRHIIGA